MRTILGKLLLTLPFIGLAAGAQEPADEPGDDTQAAPQVSAQAAQAAPAETDTGRGAIEPAVSSFEPAADTRRVSGGRVMDEIELARTEITGNRELPKVLYIVPWQKSDPGDLTGKPVNTLLDEVLAPIDRSEFLRQVEYYDDLYGTDE